MKERFIFKNKYYPFDKSSILKKIEIINIDDLDDEDDDEDDFYTGYREIEDDIDYDLYQYLS